MKDITRHVILGEMRIAAHSLNGGSMSNTEVKLGSFSPLGTAATDSDLLSDAVIFSSTTCVFSSSLGASVTSSLTSDLVSSVIGESEGAFCCFPSLDGDGDFTRFFRKIQNMYIVWQL